MKQLLFRLVGIALLVASLGAGWVWMEYRQFLATPLHIEGDGMRYEIPSGSNLSRIARELEHQGVIDDGRYLVWAARVRGLAHQVKAGEYLLSHGITPAILLHKISTGETINYAFTIVEGWSFEQLRQALATVDTISHTLGGASAATVLQKVGVNEPHPEGLFLPDTYHFPRGMTDVNFLRRAYQAMQAALKEEWESRDRSVPLETPYQALILASIVEKETAVPNERATIAGVFVRRLEKGMRLQTDPTVIYGLGSEFDGNLRRIDLLADTPYNTYRRKGLPPTPIALPGREAIHAALNPAAGDELYFVSRGDGSHAFSATLEQHNAAVVKYQLKGKARPRSIP